MSNVNLQFSGYISELAIFKLETVDQQLIDNLFLASRILGGYEIIGETYVNGIKTGDVPLVLLNKYYNSIASINSDSNGDYVFSNLQYDTYYIISIVNGATNDINGPILPTLMIWLYEQNI